MDTQQDTPYNRRSYGTSVRKNKQDSKPDSLNHTESNKHKAPILALKHALKTNSKKAAQKEQFVLKVSMYSALILAIFGISFEIFVKSMAVIFDGFVALISVGLRGIKRDYFSLHLQRR